MTEFLPLADAVERHVRPGDTLNVIMGHSRWTAAVREVARQFWGRDAGFTLVMPSLSSLGTLLFRAGALRKVVTAYSGDSFPTYSPNPVFSGAYRSGEVEVEHWSFLSYVQRLEAAAQGLPAAVTGSIRGSSMAGNAPYTEIDSPFGPVSLVAPLVPDVALLHAAVADRHGNVAMAAPLLEGVAGAYAARRGAVVTVDRVVDDLRPWADAVRLPAHRVLAVVEAPFGAHPGGLYTGRPGSEAVLPASPYGEDVPYWIEAREATRRDDLDDWIRDWCLDLETHDAYLDKLGRDRLDGLRARSDPGSWRLDDASVPIDEERPVSRWERAATWTARELVDRIADARAHAVLAGAGVANLAAWVGVARAREQGHDVRLTAELGMWDYTPTPADPFIFNFRSFPTASTLSDVNHVLGTIMGGPGTRSVACVGTAQLDREGNLNTTDIPDGPFLVGSGGANDVVTRAQQVVVVTLMERFRTVGSCGYVTSPGDRVRSVVTDKGLLRKRDGDLVLCGVPAGEGPVDERVREARAACGWDLEVVREVEEMAPPTASEVTALRNYDRRSWFLDA